MKQYDIFGIGNALMDVLIEVEDDELIGLDLKKGRFHMIDEEESKKLMHKLRNYDVKLAPGGSSANTLAAVAHMGGNVVFCGKVGKDDYGKIYEETMVNDNVKSNIAKHDLHPTGHAITLITPDSERTFSVHLGASVHLVKEDIFDQDLKKSKVLHIEGYQLEDRLLRGLCLHAMEIAKKNDVKISIDLADPGVIDRNLEDLKNIVKKHADIVFVNEEEAEVFTGKGAKDALNKIGEVCETVIVKLGESGSLIFHGGTLYEIPAFKTEAVDSTGAGDMYAAGILYGITHGWDLDKAGKLASYASSKVVSQIGARLGPELKNDIANEHYLRKD